MTGGSITNNISKDTEEVAGGGAIYTYKGSNTTLTGVTITGNEARKTGGGGICNLGTLTVDGCDPDYDYAVAADKATAIEQFSLEQATTYSSGFALAPQNAIVNFVLKNGSTIAEGTQSSPYLHVENQSIDFGGFVNVPFGAGDIIQFAIAVQGDLGSKPWELMDMSFYFADIALGDKNLVAGHVYNWTNIQPPAGAIKGKFTVNASGKQVYFSKGNLQATYNTSWSWAFATNQWDYIGNAAGNTIISGNGTVIHNDVTVDLFGWVGAACSWTGAAQYGISNSTTANQYGNVKGEALKSDWGALAISNGGNTANSGWRTLTGGISGSGEWDYLFKTRTTPSGVRYAHATVNDVPGLVLLPDDWSTSYYGLNKVNNTASTAYTDNVISSSDWTNKLEAHGAVFLPAGGYRNGVSVSRAGEQGHYWTVTTSTAAATSAIGLSFTSSGLTTGQNVTRNRGCSVRLVYDAN